MDHHSLAPLRQRRQRGITLFELLVALLVGLIVLSLALPSFSAITRDNRLTAATNELLTGLIYTRSEAVSRRHRVVMCASSDGMRCGGTKSQWHRGWIIFPDRDGDGVRDFAHEEVLQSGDSELTRDLSITFNRDAKLAYTLTGKIKRPTSDFNYNGTFYISNGGSHRLIVITRTGRPRTIRCRAPHQPHPNCP